MLLHLSIQDYLLVKHASLDFFDGLTVLTGETGAGKSMFVGALDVLLGERFPKDAVYPGAEKAVVEGVFSIDGADPFRSIVGEEEWDSDARDLLLRREISSSGRTRSYLNDHPIQQEKLLRLRELLADFHGQHEHQSLFRSSRQMQYLDVFAECGGLANAVGELYSTRTAQKRELGRVFEILTAHRKEQALLAYQLEEIERLGLKPGEEEIIKSRLAKLESSEKLAVDSGKLLELLSDSDQSMAVVAGQARVLVQSIARVDGELDPIVSELSEIEARIKDIGEQIRDYAEKLNVDESELASLRERRSVLWELKRKHGIEIAEILARADELKTLLKKGEQLEAEFKSLQEALLASEELLKDRCRTLSESRHKSATRFSEDVMSVMKSLGFPTPQFQVKLDSVAEPIDAEAISEFGIDRIEFLFSANPGSKPAPIARVASGGESSRVTLAVKSIIAEKIKYPLMIYDEIDLGISGRIADQVGHALADLGARHQVLVITHLPQIASKADHHLIVQKSSRGNTTETAARYLTEEERVQAVGALIAGAQITDKALESASELLNTSRPTKKVNHKLG